MKYVRGASVGNCPLFVLHSVHDCWLVVRLSAEGYNPVAEKGEWGAADVAAGWGLSEE